MSTKETSPGDHTIPLPEQPSGTIAEARGPKRHTLLLVYYRDGVQAVPLLPGSGIVVGREPPADLAIPDQSLSRRHARFTLVTAEEVAVEDLDSTNGTRVAGDRVQRAIMRPGDEVLLGSISASVNMMEILLLEATPERALGLGRAITARREGEPPRRSCACWRPGTS